MKKDHLEILLEDIRGNVQLVLEGQVALRHEMKETSAELKNDIDLCNFKIDALNDKIEQVDEKLSGKIDAVDKKLSDKIDGVAADLKAHRADTEAHQGLYRVREE